MAVNLKQDLVYTFPAQGVNILLNLILTLLVPKILGVEDYSYWQLFIFYSIYVGFFHFGLNDGVYLKYGGKDYDEVSRKLIGGQFGVLIATQIFLVIFLAIFINMHAPDEKRKFILYFTLFNMFATNLISFITCMFQATCRMAKFARIIIIEKLSLLVLLLVLLISRADNFYYYIYAYLISKTISLFYSLRMASEVIVFIPALREKEVLKAVRESYISGSKLLFAILSSLLLIGVSRYIIDYRWGIIVFGKLSLALSMMNFVLLFISQVGIVLFPFLRNLSKPEVQKFYLLFNRLLNALLYFALCLYYPLYLFISAWLPQYQESLIYLAALLPICIFDGKVQMLFMPCLKSFRKESLLLGINVTSLLLNITLCLYAIHINQLPLVLLALLLSVILKMFLLGLVTTRILNVNFLRGFLFDIVTIGVFIYSYAFSNYQWTNFLYPLYFLAFFVVCYPKLREDYHSLKKAVK
jgi:O-antigen/teichoic acid export membrane protein